MSESHPPESMVDLDTSSPVWERAFTVAPLVVIGTREGEGYDLAPKHMAMPVGWENHFAFACTPEHATYHNAKENGAFTVSFPGPDQVVITSLSAAVRPEEGCPTPGLDALPTEPAEHIEGRVLKGALLVLECELVNVIDGIGSASLLIGRIVAARARAEALRTTGVDDEEVIRHAPLLAYLSPGRWAEVGESRNFPFPADFKR
ncbi:MAG: flavin reductase [Gemmatimonadota bacterium]